MEDGAAERLFNEHVKVHELKFAKEKLWVYHKESVKQSAAWPEIFKNRHFLGDLLAITKGQLLKQLLFENQFSKFAKSHEWIGNADDCTAITRRPRLMLSHMWNAKRNNQKVPARYAQVQYLINAMARQPRPVSDKLDDKLPDDKLVLVSDTGDDDDTNDDDCEMLVVVKEPDAKIDLTQQPDCYDDDMSSSEIDAFFKILMTPLPPKKRDVAFVADTPDQN